MGAARPAPGKPSIHCALLSAAIVVSPALALPAEAAQADLTATASGGSRGALLAPSPPSPPEKAEAAPVAFAAPAPSAPPPAPLSALPGGVLEASRWSAGFQSTYVYQYKPAFSAAYTGPNSLLTTAESGYTLTATLFLGVSPWAGGEVFFNPEVIQSQELSHLTGLGGLTNGENQKTGGALPNLYRARLFLRQTIPLGGERSLAEAGPNQFGGEVDSRRLVITAGNFAVTDVFYGNTFAHDPRTQFLNWSLMTYGASDFAADSRGYTWGFALECDLDQWALRAGRFAQPKQSNGLALDYDLLSHYGDSVEVERGHVLWGRGGKVGLAGWRNHARMGGFRDALAYARANGGTPDVANVRRDQTKYGFGVNLEQEVSKDVGLFARYSYNDGQTEAYAFTEIERSLIAGLSVKGRTWGRAEDTLGVAYVQNGLSRAHQDYLAAGGLGFFIGDGRIDYRPERIVEAYYSFNAFRGLWFSVDGQHIANPAYNASRGPVNVFGCRFHLEH